MNPIKEFSKFSPALTFLARFIGLYLVTNLIYGFYVSAYRPLPDPFTHWVTAQTAVVLTWVGEDVDIVDHKSRPYTIVYKGGTTVISVFEGCNGVNTAIIFIAFLIAFGPQGKKLLWYSIAGILAIHLLNIIRLIGLAFVTLYMHDSLYFFHKYVFTAFLYAFIFLFWMIWVRYFAIKAPHVRNTTA